MTTITELHNLQGKVALITGGSRHLGFDAADALAEMGCNLILTSRKQENSTIAAETLRKRHHIQVLPLALDICNHEMVVEVIKKAKLWKGKLDILVNNAGGSSGTGSNHLFDRKPEDIKELIMTNLVGTLYCCKEAGRIMVNQGSGKIINIASMAGMIGRDRRIYDQNNMKGQPIDYAAAKAGIIGMTKDLAGLLSPQGVYVNAISPGGFGPRDLPLGFVNDYNEKTPLGRMGHDEKDLKGAILFLASKASDYVTGHNLVVDGGFTIWL